MAFHDDQLPTDVERGALGGPRFKTTVLEMVSGEEKRNIDWSKTRGQWDVGYGIQKSSDLQDVIDFFYARQGRAHSFRFKDWADFTIGDAVTPTPQSIGTGDNIEVDFQIFKRYSSGGTDFDRAITKPINASTDVYLGGVLQGGGYTLDGLTGIITFAAAPGGAVDVAVVAEFDVPVRFDLDALDVNVAIFDSAAAPNIPVIEVKGE
jgi:uncharacterized protein (TIGR02217 family)